MRYTNLVYRIDSYAIYQLALLNPSQRSQLSQIDAMNENVDRDRRASALVTVFVTMWCSQNCSLCSTTYRHRIYSVVQIHDEHACHAFNAKCIDWKVVRVI
jgi:hypothetical protein